MKDSQPSHGHPRESDNTFPTTRWSLISQIRGGNESQRAAALESLCEAYWFPIYAVVRGRGFSSHDAEDFTQELFRSFLKSGSFASADRSHGRLRAYLMTSLRNLLAAGWRAKKAIKRGGQVELVSMDIGWAEDRIRHEPQAIDSLCPEKQFDRRWLLVILGRVEAVLAAEYERADKSLVFATLSNFLSMDSSKGSYAGAAGKLGIQESYVKVLVHRLRARFRSLLREEISHTVQSPEEVEAELRHLREAFQ
jgi:RNA polymerase sigma factor (sigma-70 family)